MKKDTRKTGKLRPPIVVVLGHVDHGKTTLLDKIRKTNITNSEAGGITQSIGASSVTTKQGKEITFIDTPGHAAFSKMRSRGAKVADLALLVVAVDDGVKPQTTEALSYIKEAKIPFVVVVNKTDLPDADIKKVKLQLEKEKVSFEGSGGDTPLVKVSAKSGEGVDELLEMIILLSEINEFKDDRDNDLEAVVIETSKDNRGPLVTLVVRSGTLRVGVKIVSEKIDVKIRGLFDTKGVFVKEIYPGQAGLVLGFSKLPQIGSVLKANRVEENSSVGPKQTRSPIKLREEEVPIVFKAISSGSLEAVKANLPEKIVIVHSGVGSVIQNDVFLAKSTRSARIFTFESKVPASILKLAEAERVEIEQFDVIYKLLERLEELLTEGEKKILGKAEIQAEFPFNDDRVAGCKVLEGRIAKGDHVVLERDEKEVGSAKVASLRKEKKGTSVVKKDEEFGLILKPQLDFRVGDVILSVII